MAVQQRLVGLPAASLQKISDACEQAIVAGSVRGISYSIAGRQFTFPSLESAATLLQEAQYALGLLTGTRSDCVRANFNPSFRRG